MSIITFADLAAYMGNVDLTPTQKTLVENVIIPGVQQQLETHLNRLVELVQVRESLQPDCDGYIYFTYAPVRKLLGITWSSDVSTPLDITQYTPPPVVVDPSLERPVIDRTAIATTASGYRYQVGLQGFPGLAVSGGNQPYVVADYIAGYDGENDKGLQLDVLRVVAREVERQFDTTAAIRNGNLEPATQSDLRIKGWTAEELAAWNRLKRRIIL